MLPKFFRFIQVAFKFARASLVGSTLLVLVVAIVKVNYFIGELIIRSFIKRK